MPGMDTEPEANTQINITDINPRLNTSVALTAVDTKTVGGATTGQSTDFGATKENIQTTRAAVIEERQAAKNYMGEVAKEVFGADGGKLMQQLAGPVMNTSGQAMLAMADPLQGLVASAATVIGAIRSEQDRIKAPQVQSMLEEILVRVRENADPNKRRAESAAPPPGHDYSKIESAKQLQNFLQTPDENDPAVMACDDALLTIDQAENNQDLTLQNQMKTPTGTLIAEAIKQGDDNKLDTMLGDEKAKITLAEVEIFGSLPNGQARIPAGYNPSMPAVSALADASLDKKSTMPDTALDLEAAAQRLAGMRLGMNSTIA